MDLKNQHLNASLVYFLEATIPIVATTAKAATPIVIGEKKL
ncbi:hypothetical protein [Legionella bozemanae]|nr:hypothetical protein [Legionella bozemanae]